LAVSVVLLLSFIATASLRWPPSTPASLAVPSNTVILFFLIRPLTPLLSWFATLRERSTIFLGS
jgi:hypothetical protein